MIASLAVLGGGAWGTALALVGIRAGLDVALWARNPTTSAALAERAENPLRLPGLRLERAIAATDRLDRVLGADLVILAVPAQAVREVAARIAGRLRPGTPVVIAAKGLERTTGRRLSEVLAELVPEAIPAALSGPSFATDVARGLPTAVAIATEDEETALYLCRALGSASFRPYAETDLVGVEIGGAMKNVIAIAAGAVNGRGLGASAEAALIARGFAELRRFAKAFGARPETLMGLSGLGDLVLTCSSRQSRNFAFGIALGGGGEAPPGTLVEGAATAAIARDLAARHAVEMPITDAVAAVLEGALSVDQAIEDLLRRPLRREAD